VNHAREDVAAVVAAAVAAAAAAAAAAVLPFLPIRPVHIKSATTRHTTHKRKRQVTVEERPATSFFLFFFELQIGLK